MSTSLLNVCKSLLRFLHYGVLLFSLFAWLAPIPLLWKIHLFALPLMVIQWKLNRNTCILSNLENLLDGRKFYDDSNEGQFIKSMLGNCFNPLPSDTLIACGTYGLMLVSWGLSLWRVLS